MIQSQKCSVCGNKVASHWIPHDPTDKNTVYYPRCSDGRCKYIAWIQPLDKRVKISNVDSNAVRTKRLPRRSH